MTISFGSPKYPAGQLADDENVEIFHQLALQRGSFRQRRIADRRAQVGEKLKILAQAQKAGFRALVVRHIVPLRPADRAEQHRIGGKRPAHRLVRHRFAMRIEGRAADEVFFDLEPGKPRLGKPGHQLLHLKGGFGADPVAGKQKDIGGDGHGGSSFAWMGFGMPISRPAGRLQDRPVTARRETAFQRRAKASAPPARTSAPPQTRFMCFRTAFPPPNRAASAPPEA